MKKRLIPLLLIFGIGIAGALGVVWFKTNSKAPSESQEKQRFVIARGSSATQIADRLKKQGLIKSALAFKIYVQATDKADKIQAGEYSLFPNYSLPKIVDVLLSGPEELWVTIPEGLRREEIAQKIISTLGLQAVDADNFRSEFLLSTDGQEGYLFPDTYLFPRDIKAVKVVETMTTTFDKQLEKIISDTSRVKSGLTQKDEIVLASIIERETKTSNERPIVAGILIKRLNAGWPLQVDASVQYAVANAKITNQGPLEKYWEPLTKEDIEITSLFNTYKYKGLPPSPIANPGASSLSAAIYPVESEYWFYIHDTEGNIHYAKDSEEHNQNIVKYLNE